MKLFCLGFAFTRDLKKVLLIQQAKPGEQFGRFNGLGGKVEPLEAPLMAMIREFKEECSVITRTDQWVHFARFGTSEWQVECYASRGAFEWEQVHPSSEGSLNLHEVNAGLTGFHMPNLNWLIPMAENAILGNAESSFLDIRY